LYGETEKPPGRRVVRVVFVLRVPGIGIVGKRQTSAKPGMKNFGFDFSSARKRSLIRANLKNLLEVLAAPHQARWLRACTSRWQRSVFFMNRFHE
jgi:hypothetical protein